MQAVDRIPFFMFVSELSKLNSALGGGEKVFSYFALNTQIPEGFI